MQKTKIKFPVNVIIRKPLSNSDNRFLRNDGVWEGLLTLPDLVLNCRSLKSQEFAVKHLSKFIEKGKEISDAQAEHIIDWLDSDASPKRVAKMSVPQAIAGAEKWQQAMNKKRAIIEDAEFVEEVFISSDKKFRIVKLIGEPAFKREGILMKHCVASYFGRTDCTIYSLRDELNKPHCTMELGGGMGDYPTRKYIRQIRGNSNQAVKGEYAQPVLEFLKSIGVQVDSSQLRYLGYEAFNNKFLEILSNKRKIRRIVIGETSFVLTADLYQQINKQ